MTSGHRRPSSTEHESLVGGLLLATSTTDFNSPLPNSEEEEALLWSQLLGRPLVAWSLSALLAVEELTELVLIVGPGKEPAARALVQASFIGHRTVRVTSGVDPRRAVEIGLDELAVTCQLVVIQEASRPLVTPETIRRGIQVAQEHPSWGAVAGLPVKETIKRVDQEGVVVGTLPREQLALLQTPQVFPLRLLHSAYASWRRSRSFQERAVVDPVTVALSSGMKLVPFAAPGEDMLVAGPADLGIAEVLLRHRAS